MTPIGDLREQYLDLLELVEERTIHDPQPRPSLEKLYGITAAACTLPRRNEISRPPRCMQNLRADLIAIVEHMLDEHAREAAEQVATQ